MLFLCVYQTAASLTVNLRKIVDSCLAVQQIEPALIFPTS